MHHMRDLFFTGEWDFVETENGVQINVKGDPKKLMADLEAIKALMEFKSKAKAAGWGHCKGFHDKMRAHFHKHHQGCKKEEL